MDLNPGCIPKLRMMKSLFSIMLLLISTGLNAQVSLYGTGGYNLSWLNGSELEKAINTYNGAQGPFEEKMRPISPLRGPTAGLGLSFSEIAVTFSYTLKQNSSSATWYDNQDNLHARDLKFDFNTFSLFLGKFPQPKTTFALGGGLGIDYGKATLSGRTGEAAIIKSIDYQEISDQNVLSIAPQFKFFLGLHENVFLIVTSYYSYNVVFSEFSRLYEFLDPAGFANTAPALNKGKFNNYGISLGLAYAMTFE